jgi:BASS family bile acid:Na+ symporter
MGLNDLVLFAVVFLSMGVAVWVPELGRVFEPYLIYYMMLLLFLSFLKIRFAALIETSWTGLYRLGILSAIKLIVLPAALYWVTLVLLPDYAIPVLLLTGISTGVVAPFMGMLVQADMVTVLRMVMITSVLVPFSLPALVKVMVGAEVTISLWAMISMLALVIFVPLTAVLLARRIAPRLLATIRDHQFPISMVLFALVNFGVFSKYSSFFFAHPGQIALSAGVAYVLSLVYYAAGFALTVHQEPSQRMAAGISFAILNNVLVIIFSSNFFGPLSPTLAAMYMLPYYTMVVPAKLVAQRVGAPHNGQGSAR